MNEMKKPLLVAVFSLVVLAPLDCLAQTARVPNEVSGKQPPARGVSRQTAKAVSKDSTNLPKTAERTKAVSSLSADAALEAQKSYKAGVAFYDSSEFEKAVVAFSRANQLNPNDPQTHYMLGMVHWKSKSFESAATSFKLALRLKPDWPEALLMSGATSYVIGKPAQMHKAYLRLQELKSPLARKLQLIGKNERMTDVTQQPRSKPSGSTTNQAEASPVSAPANMNPTVTTSSDQTPPSAVSLKNIPVTAASSPERVAPVTPIAPAEPSLNNKRTTTEDAALTEIYRIGVGDVLDIRFSPSNLNRSTLYTVIDGGLIDFPIAGGLVSVAGLTSQEVQSLITSELNRRAVSEQAQITVGVRQYGSHTVIVTGLVSSPGTKTLRREAVPLYVLLAEAQPRSDAARAVVMRAGDAGIAVELSDPAALHFIVRPGDVINVMAREQGYYYIAGRVNHPGQKAFQPGITLLQAILAAGGLARDASVELSREGSNGLLTTTKLSLNDIKSGKIQDLKLQIGDRIEVFQKKLLPF